LVQLSGFSRSENAIRGQSLPDLRFPTEVRHDPGVGYTSPESTEAESNDYTRGTDAYQRAGYRGEAELVR